MLKALLKKELYSLFSVFTTGKDGKRRPVWITLVFVALIVYALGSIGNMFWMLADTLCLSLTQSGMAWVYFAFMGVIGAGMSAMIAIFMAKVKLYEAKDNDLLLSMPIPSSAILFSRIISMYLLSFCLCGFVFVPTIIRYFTLVGFSILPVLCSLAVLFILPLLSLLISCLVGWLIALISAKIPKKNTVEIVFALAFLIAYFILYSKINEYLSYVIAHGEAVGRVMKTALYPFAQLGYACTGKVGSLLLYALMFIGSFALVYWLMSVNYLRLATTNKAKKKIKYKGKGYQGRSEIAALVKKEWKRYASNGLLVMNCFLGPVLLILAPVLVLFEGEDMLLLATGLQGKVGLIITAFVGLAASTNLYATSCISLEGESLDVLRVLPIKSERILFAKWLVHVLTTGIPALLSSVFLCIFFKQSITVSMLVVAVSLIFVLFSGGSGIAVNLLFPNLKWTNEVAVVKQSMASLVSMFGEMGVVGLLIGGYFLFGKLMPEWSFLLVCGGFLALAGVGIYLFLKKKGVKIFEGL